MNDPRNSCLLHRSRVDSFHTARRLVQRRAFISQHTHLRPQFQHLELDVSVSAATAEPGTCQDETQQAKALTPRQRRLAQQRRKWEEEQQQQRQRPAHQQKQQQQQKQQSPPLHSAPAAASAAPTPPAPHQHLPSQAAGPSQFPPDSSPSRTLEPSPSGARTAPAPAARRQPASAGTTATSAAPSAGSGFPRPDNSAPAQAEKRTKPASPGAPRAAAAGGASTNKSEHAAAVTSTAPPTALTRSAATAITTGSSPSRPGSQSAGQPLPSFPSLPHASTSDMPWPSLFVGTSAGAAGRSSQPSVPTASVDMCSMPGADLASLARHWVEELVQWEADRGSVRQRPAGRAGAAAQAAGEAGEPSPLLASLPEAATARLAALTAAVTAHVTRGSLGHQELADLVWAVAHYDRDHALRVLQPAMEVPFSVVPQFMPELRLEDFMAEVELRRDVIYLDDGSRAVEESRLTGWQSEIGATFKYSGKEMQPQAGGLSPNMVKVRDALQALTGVLYDSALVNYYADGKCGMRYHVDPLYDRWTPNSAVVSLGATRSFIFRAIGDHATRWHYRVRNGDVVLMFGDCQDRLQHCVRVERRAEDAGPRMSLVFKERLRGPEGGYLLP